MSVRTINKFRIVSVQPEVSIQSTSSCFSCCLLRRARISTRQYRFPLYSLTLLCVWIAVPSLFPRFLCLWRVKINLLLPVLLYSNDFSVNDFSLPVHWLSISVCDLVL
ncbi:hypothetical protein CRM22_000872 [Opisthorchis felineus]|uniref:Uncharacterized protein n=1 Tax=Opisthorchis felineus TaxID=147828 RepID=A0A4V3SH20_OPIFE|nr:hypothetical protein CRM22_000872 [Opisthorchis felineus]